MSNKLKPDAYMHYFIGGYPPDEYFEDFELIKPCDLEVYPVENNDAEGVIPLYIIPPGYTLVPDEPTEEMINAAWHVRPKDMKGNRESYKAMLKAAKEQT